MSKVVSGVVLGRRVSFLLRVSRSFSLLGRHCLDSRRSDSGLLFLWVFLGVRSPTLVQSWGEALIGDGCVFMGSGVGGLDGLDDGTVMGQRLGHGGGVG